MLKENKAKVRKTGLFANVVDVLFLGIIAGLCWPRYFLPAAVFGMICGRKFICVGKEPHFAFIWCLSSILFHFYIEEYSYSFMYAVNPAFFVTATVLALIVIVAGATGRTRFGVLVVFLITLISFGITKAIIGGAFLGIMFYLLFSWFSGAANRARPLLLGLATFNIFLVIGLASVYDGDYINNFRSDYETYQQKKEMWWPADGLTARLHSLSVKETSLRNYGDIFSRVIPYEPTNEVFLLRKIVKKKRKRSMQVVTLDMKTYKVRRESFPYDSGGSNLMFDISADTRFIALIIGKKVVLMDGKTFEWIDTLDLGLRNLSDIRFGPTGELFVTNMRVGILYKLQYDRYGHGLRVDRQRKLGAGILSLAFIQQWNLLARISHRHENGVEKQKMWVLFLWQNAPIGGSCVF